MRPPSFSCVGIYQFRPRLTLAELGATSGSVQAVLLTFLHAGIAGEEPVVSQCLEVFFVVANQGPGESHSDGTGLPGQAATGNAGDDIHAIGRRNVFQRLHDRYLVLRGRKENFEWFSVNRDFACPRANTNAGDRAFTTTSAEAIAVNLVFLDSYHGIYSI